ncbi:unnamed protein product [Rotaria sp. Silwood2]|nr:unnamed protein product [Rotaria sp. Silwood2]
MNYKSIVFREFTQESFRRIEHYRQVEAECIASERLERPTIPEDDNNKRRCMNKSSEDESISHTQEPNKELAVGQTLPRLLQNKFPAELIGKPIEEIDSYYRAEYIFVVINRNNTIFRFSATPACFIFSPFNCFRRLAIRILTHSLFSTLVMLTILTNCIFMTLRNPPETTEYVFTIIYTLEALTKCVARGFILQKYTFLRDPWNWLDFIVITLAYITFFINLGNVAVLRTFRVLRALKTVAVVPGLQLYMGALRQKCVQTYEYFLNSSNFSSIGFNMSYESYFQEIDNETYWYKENDLYVLCGNASGSTKCPNGYVCMKDRGQNPDYGYTSFDNYGWAMLACFRLMTQDYWENLYQLILSAAGRYHFLYFLAIIFFGSFYLVNLILAIVSMSYLEQQKLVEAENEERERRKIQDDIELKNEEAQKASEAHAFLNVENALCFEDSNHKISHSAVSIEYEQNEKKNELSNTQSFQILSSINTMKRDAIRIPIFNGTLQNSANENKKNQQTSNFSHLSEENQNNIDSPITVKRKYIIILAFLKFILKLYQVEPHIKYAPIAEILSAQELDRTSVRLQKQYTVLYKVDRGTDNQNNLFVENDLQLTVNEYERQLQYHYKRHMNIVVSNMDKTNTYDRALVKILRIYCRKWSCESSIFQKLQAAVAFFILDAFVDLFITICIILNTLFMALDQPGQSEKLARILTAGNYVFTTIFTAESFALARFLFDLTTNQKFDIFIMICIFLNMLCMCLEHDNQSHTYDLVLGYMNNFFVAIFTIECVMKLVALNFKYFTIPWNVFDFIIVIASILGQTLGEIMAKFFVHPTLLRVVRVARVGRILRLVKGAKGIRTLLFALVVSMPALLNIGLLLFLVMFIYSIFGMSFFAYVRKSAGITDLFNFETFPNSMIVLFQMCTTAGWSGVFQALTNDRPPDCDPTINTPSNKGDCGDTAIATPFIVSYVIITSLVVVNMYIAVILENFCQAHEDVQQGLTDDDYDMYYEKWQHLDPSGSQFIRYDQLSDFVDGLEPPLRISKPNHLALVAMNLPICEHDRMHCVDILDGLTKYFLGALHAQVARTEADVPIDIKNDRPKDYHPITTTVQRHRELYLSRLGLKGFRTNVERRYN